MSIWASLATLFTAAPIGWVIYSLALWFVRNDGPFHPLVLWDYDKYLDWLESKDG